MAYESRFTFILGAGAGQNPTIWQNGKNAGASVTDDGAGVYYVEDLPSGVYSVKVGSNFVNGLVDLPHMREDFVDHETAADPHPDFAYTETAFSSLLNEHHHATTGDDHDDRYYTETEMGNRLCPGDEDAAALPPVTANQTEEGALWYHNHAFLCRLAFRYRRGFDGDTLSISTIIELETYIGG